MNKTAISNKYVFKPYNQIFPELFKNEKKRIQIAIGNNLPILHMGSTAVPNLGGKGIIDIYVVVPTDRMSNVSQLVQKIGYEYCPDSGSLNRLFHKIDLEDPVDGQRRYHLHVVAENSVDYLNSLFFKNYLRIDSKAMAEYSEIKKYAASIADESKKIYMATKEVVIKKIIKKAFYNLVSHIPEGKVTTYGQLAKVCGFKTPRYVGYLLSRNEAPETVPCHRVVHSNGILSGNYAFGGLEAKKQKLKSEGVEIINNRINLQKFGWEPEAKFDD